MVWSSFLFSSLSLSSSSFHQDGPCNEGKLWSLWNGQRCAALMNERNTRRAVPRSSLPRRKKPQDASWRRPPPSTGVSSLVKGGIKRRQRGKVIFFSCLSILSVRFSYFLLCAVIKLIIILARAPQVRTNGVLCILLSSELSCFRGEGSHINIWSSPFRDAVRKPDVPPLKNILAGLKHNMWANLSLL